MTVLVGTSGWQYRHWRYRYFKRGTPQNRWFEQVMRDFQTVELNVTFYRLPRMEVFAGWYDRDLQVDVANLDATLSAFPQDLRLAVEPRHESWWTDDVRQCLEKHNAALCWADRKGAITPLWRTADWGYLRFHEGRDETNGWPFYRDDELQWWADTICEVLPDDASDIYVYFNNDPGGAALEDAITFAQQLEARGRTVSRVPAERPDLAADPEASRAADSARSG